MESFVSNTKLHNRLVSLLVIPDDCDSHEWETLEGDSLTEEELNLFN